MEISSYKLNKGRNIKILEKYFPDDKMVYSLTIDTKNSIEKSIFLLPYVVYELLPLFNNKNNFPSIEEINIHIDLNLLCKNKSINYILYHNDIYNIQNDLDEYSNNFMMLNANLLGEISI